MLLNQKKSDYNKIPDQEAPKTREQKKLSYNEKREFESLIQQIRELESRKQQLTQEMNQKTEFGELEAIGKEIGELSKKIDEKEIRWLELSEKENS